MAAIHTELLRGRRLLFIQEHGSLPPALREDLARLDVEIVGPAGDIGEARRLISAERIDGAIVDLDFPGPPAIELADDLLARGIPFVFAMEESRIEPAHYPGFVLCRRPVFLDEIARILFADEPAKGSS
jgi:hypothetical protein